MVTCSYQTYAFQRMPFEFCSAPGKFQRCMMAIFYDLLEKCVEVFMNDFSIFGNSFDLCLENISAILKRCEETNMVLNWEKCHFIVDERRVLGHRVSANGLKVDKAKIEVIEKLSQPSNIKKYKLLWACRVLHALHQRLLSDNQSFMFST